MPRVAECAKPGPRRPKTCQARRTTLGSAGGSALFPGRPNFAPSASRPQRCRQSQSYFPWAPPTSASADTLDFGGLIIPDITSSRLLPFRCVVFFLARLAALLSDDDTTYPLRHLSLTAILAPRGDDQGVHSLHRPRPFFRFPRGTFYRRQTCPTTTREPLRRPDLPLFRGATGRRKESSLRVRASASYDCSRSPRHCP